MTTRKHTGEEPEGEKPAKQAQGEHAEKAAKVAKAAGDTKAEKAAESEAEAKAEADADDAEAPKETEAKPTARKKPKERTFIDAKTGKAIAHPHEGGSGAAATKAVRDEMHVERAGAALPFRIGAGVLWALGIACEVLAILTMNGTLFLPGPTASTWLIILIVIDLVLVVIGSQLWKHANHVAPASKENKLAYWAQTDLGIIVAAIAFAPVILLMLTNKDLGKGTKRIGVIVAAIALVVAVGSGIDYHPATQEDLDQAEAGAAVLAEGGLAYWTPFGEMYHFNPDCQYLKNSGTICFGSVQDAIDAKRTRGCSGCTVEDGTDVLSKADPAAVAAAAASAIRVGDAAGNGATGNGGAEHGADAADAGAAEKLPKAA